MQRFPKLTILGIKIDQSSKNDLLSYVETYLLNSSARPLSIFTPNPEQIVYANEHPEFREVLNSSDIALPDGQGVVFASQILQFSIFNFQFSKIKRIPGIEFMEELVKLAVEKGYPVALIGGRGRVAEKALNVLQKKYSGLSGWAETPPEFNIKYQMSNLKYANQKSQNDFTSHLSLLTYHPHEKEYFKQIAEKIGKSGVKLVFIGLGAPKQEMFIRELTAHSSQLTAKAPLVLMSVGGSFDIISGKISRSPAWLQDLGLEWLWRLLKEPWRFGRQLQLLKFIWLILKDRFMVKSKY